MASSLSSARVAAFLVVACANGAVADPPSCAPVERALTYDPRQDALAGGILGLADGSGSLAAQRSRATAAALRRARSALHRALDARLARRNPTPLVTERLHSLIDAFDGPVQIADLGDGSVVACLAFPVGSLRERWPEGRENLWHR